ncbi:MAG: hypothetical protein IPK31_13700 [Chitinophagaceae bacterium]|nr:hypothetical protein [Chitinophagaceae bacterium]
MPGRSDGNPISSVRATTAETQASSPAHNANPSFSILSRMAGTLFSCQRRFSLLSKTGKMVFVIRRRQADMPNHCSKKNEYNGYSLQAFL